MFDVMTGKYESTRCCPLAAFVMQIQAITASEAFDNRKEVTDTVFGLVLCANTGLVGGSLVSKLRTSTSWRDADFGGAPP